MDNNSNNSETGFTTSLMGEQVWPPLLYKVKKIAVSFPPISDKEELVDIIVNDENKNNI